MNESQNPRPLLAVVACAMVVLVVAGPTLLRGPTFIDEIKFVNPSDYDIHVEVSGGDAEGWLSLTTADKNATTAAVDVMDQGAVWVFRFSAQGRPAGELRTTRTELEQAGWSIEIPSSVIGRLREQRTPPSP